MKNSPVFPSTLEMAELQVLQIKLYLELRAWLF